MSDKKPDHQTAAERIHAKLPKPVRDATEIVAGGGAYTLLKHDGKTVASVRGKNCRVTFGHDGSADAVAGLAKVIADAAKSREEAAPAEGDKRGGESE